MKRVSFLPGIFIIIALANPKFSILTNAQPGSDKNKANPPVAIKKNYEHKAHGDIRLDEYYWMNDYFKKGPDSSLVVDYLKAENQYTDQLMGHTKAFQEDLFQEMKSRIKEKDESVPVLMNGYMYYTKTEEGKQYYKAYRRKGDMNGAEELLLDVDAMAEGHAYYAIGGMNISPDNKWMAYGVDEVSRRQYTIHFKNLETGEIIGDRIVNTSGSVVWAKDNKTVFYTEKDPVTLLTEKIKKHILGTDPAKDEIVYEEKDPSNYIGVAKSRSGDFIFIVSQATMSSEFRYLPANKPNDDFAVFQPRMKNVLYQVDHWKNQFLIRTNKDALNFKVMQTPINNTGQENWKEVIGNRSDVLLEDMDMFEDYWVFTERKNGLLQIRVRDKKTEQEHYLDFGEPAYSASVGDNREFHTKKLRYNYTSMTTPGSVFDYDLESHTKKLMKEQEVIGSFKKENYQTERLWATATDGTKIPISVVYKKGFIKNGKNPLLLYGYGSYGYSMDAGFSSSRLSLLDRGFAFAIAHIRGGQEMGRQWYEDGKMMKKKNTFTDFIDCAKYLVSAKYTSPEHLYAMGGSAGGLLMGAVVNIAPELFNGVVASVPFVDVITTMSDPTIPLTTNEYDEWGNPENKDAYQYMKSYSPYDNVTAKSYPNMLVETGLHDSQVQYFEPAKWVARLRAVKKGNNLLLLQTNMDAGHGGASGRFERLKEVAREYAFFFMLEGITK